MATPKNTKRKKKSQSKNKPVSFYKKIDTRIIDILTDKGISKLYPPQEKAVVPGVDHENIIVSIPTASGKTLISEIIMIQRLLEFKKRRIKRKAIYLCPLKALASEKYYEFREKWSKIGLKIGYSVGDVDNYDFRIFNNDIIIMTNEKADSLFRNRSEYIKQIGVLVIDEIHLLNDPSRGITLEILLTRIREINPSVQIVGLSATISNAHEVANWLDAKLIKSDWRPVILKEGFYHEGAVYYESDEMKNITYQTKDPVYNLVMDVLDDGGQCLVFVNSRRNSRSAAEKLMKKLLNRYSNSELLELQELSEEFKKVTNPGDITKDAQLLINTLKGGVAFHNAGLTQEQRKFIEDNFRKGIIRVLTATPTLAAGVNTPARRVIIQSVFRYDGKAGGMQKIPVMEYKQMVGRAGRPGYDPYGDSVLLSSNSKRTEELAAYYVFGEPEWVISKLNTSHLLQTHILGSITMKNGNKRNEVIKFLTNTFLSYQIQKGTNDINPDNVKIKKKTKKINIQKAIKQPKRRGARGTDPLNLPNYDLSFKSAAEILEEPKNTETKNEDPMDDSVVSKEDLTDKISKIVDEALDFLNSYEFIKKRTEPGEPDESGVIEIPLGEDVIFIPTRLGKITSQLYLNPIVAEGIFRRLNLLNKLIIDKEDGKFKINEVTLLYVMALSGEFLGINYRNSDYDLISAVVRNHMKSMNMFTFDYHSEENIKIFDDMSSLKQTFILMEWINERAESDIVERYSIGSGDLQRLRDTAQWLARAIFQFSKLIKSKKIQKLSENLNMRLRYGIKKELIPFVKLKGIGRIRARTLYKGGFFSINDVRNASEADLERLPLFSKNIIKSIKNQITSGSYIRHEESDNAELEDDVMPMDNKKAVVKKQVKNKKIPKKGSKKKKQTTLF